MSLPCIGNGRSLVFSICARCWMRQLRSTARPRTFLKNVQSRGHSTNVLRLLEERGYVNQIAGDRNVLQELLSARPVGAYVGIDPTAPSLHLGHLLPLMVIFWLYMHGHHVVSLVGGATAKVGDPTGRLQSRARASKEMQDRNTDSMFDQLAKMWENVDVYGRRHGYQPNKMGRRTLLNNSSWLNNLGILDFLGHLGTGARLGAMLGRDTVKNKMEKGDGMSFSEFTYPLLQSWDWWHMYKTMDVQVQIGGSDQYGNIVAGLDAINYMRQDHRSGHCHKVSKQESESQQSDKLPMGLTVPLLTTSRGEKFGKSEGNAIWLDKQHTTAFDLYGFLLRSADADVERYLKLFTFVSLPEIAVVMKEHDADPAKRLAQHLLAQEVLELVHGSEESKNTAAEHKAMRQPHVAMHTLKHEHIRVPRSLVMESTFPKLLYHAGLVSTKSEGSRLVARGGAYVAIKSSHKTAADDSSLEFVPVKDQLPSDAVREGILLLRLGKWKVRVIEVIDDELFAGPESEASGGS